MVMVVIGDIAGNGVGDYDTEDDVDDEDDDEDDDDVDWGESDKWEGEEEDIALATSSPVDFETVPEVDADKELEDVPDTEDVAAIDEVQDWDVDIDWWLEVDVAIAALPKGSSATCS